MVTLHNVPCLPYGNYRGVKSYIAAVHVWSCKHAQLHVGCAMALCAFCSSLQAACHTAAQLFSVAHMHKSASCIHFRHQMDIVQVQLAKLQITATQSSLQVGDAHFHISSRVSWSGPRPCQQLSLLCHTSWTCLLLLV